MKRLLLVLAFVMSSAQAFASDCWNNVTVTQTNCGAVNMWLNGSNQSVPTSSTNPMPMGVMQLNGVALGSPTAPGVTPSGNLIGVNTVFSNSLLGGTNFIGFTGSNPFIAGTGVAALSSSSGVVANTAATATLAAAVGKTTYISGFEVTANGATAASCTGFSVTGTLGGALSYVFCWPAGATSPATPLAITFNPAIPASASNTAIVVSVPAAGAGNTGTAVNARGFQQ